MKEHRYQPIIEWTGNRGTGTSGYRDYDRSHVLSAGSKPPIPGSSDPAFRGDAAAWNPEDLLVASISSCHMLWYLHLASAAKVVVIGYRDQPEGVMAEDAKGSGRFTHAILRPEVTIAADSDAAKAAELHHEAHAMCFIANSVNFPIECQPVILVAPHR